MQTPTTPELLARIGRHLLQHTQPFNYRWEHCRNAVARDLRTCERTGAWPSAHVVACDNQQFSLSRLQRTPKMNTIATFENTVGILVKAYLEGVLNEADCAACACGNMVAAANGYAIADSNLWKDANGAEIVPAWGTGNAQGLREVASTGYTRRDFNAIELAFMDFMEGDFESKDARDFAGLMAVVDVLADIHGIDLSTATAAKALFVKAA